MLPSRQFESKAESDAWWAALDRVKVGEFAKLGYREPLRGVVHQSHRFRFTTTSCLFAQRYLKPARRHLRLSRR